jgi:hypothetical protein
MQYVNYKTQMLFSGYESKHKHARRVHILNNGLLEEFVHTQWGLSTNVLDALLDNRNQLLLGIFYFPEIVSTLIGALSKIACRLNKM